MSLAPASSLGAFLNARLAVNGIQCAARSFGTLTAAGRGLLSSMGASCVLENWRVWRNLSASLRDGNADKPRYFRSFGRLEDWAGSQIGGADPEYLALGILRVEPQ